MELIPSQISNKRILLAALDWGMGHTTRCVSIIRQLLEQNNTVIFAGTDFQCEFMLREFPGLSTRKLDGYEVTLDSSRSTYWQLFLQFQKMKRAMRKEQHALRGWVANEHIDLVISDNRYGFFHAATQNILITHQLNLQLPFLGKPVNRKLKKWIEKFDSVWIPDNEKNSLCGKLIEAELKIPKVFINHLCRFKKQAIEKQYVYLGVVSGPEPERSAFAQMLNNYLVKQNKKSALVGFSGDHPQIDYFLNPSSSELEKLINTSDMVISRAGYTTIMELIVLEKKAVLIPTPGQFEQEYLAKTIQSDLLQFVPEKDFFS